MPEKKDELKKAVGTIADLHAELIRKGLSEATAKDIASRIAGAASSFSDGHCGSYKTPLTCPK